MTQQRVYFNSRDKLIRVNIEKIVYFEGDGNYTYIVTANKQKLCLTINLAHTEEALASQLGDSFGATQLVMSPKNETAKASLVFGGVSYPLEEGQNIVGRKATTSTANVQIETADRYMSRQHCSITVTTLPDGKKKAVLSNYQNKNQTTIDGQSIETGDAIRLTDGNSITMGHTTITFKLS